MRISQLLAGCLFLSLAGTASASPLVLVTVNTGAMGLNNDNGSLDFMFNGSAGSQAATVQILNFSGATYIAASQVDTGTASGGPLPSAITINAGNPDSDDFEAVKFGNLLSFDVRFSGPAIDSPSGAATGTNVFSFFLYSDQPGSVPASTTDANGTVEMVAVNLNGTLSFNPISPDSSAQVVPEPSTMGLVFGALVMWIGGLFVRRRLTRA